ncbi:hypothetical protein IB275_20610 [Pseudomonas sp. PDM21]|uniref:hypothetical protein n=1 Tax=Pseudomonas sp. PDM21 TaxID=2769257 RepID=UPI0017814B28|nr:hypothetical protein [Pseudomonas sp. PDM21]MBD9672994.1 hypothetical protein [Pseudomonas sp. PDM21]
MSDEGKEAPCLGFHPAQARKYRMERLARPSQWSPGVRVTSAEEYDRFTDQLAGELLATCTPEHLAVIAAQHMMYADELKCVLEEKKAEQVAVVEIARKVATDVTREIATEVSMTVLKAYRTHLSKKRADAVKEGKKDVIALAQEIADKAWQKDTEQKIRIGEMARRVCSALLETEHHKLVSEPSRVQRWIRAVAPDYASKPGRQRRI